MSLIPKVSPTLFRTGSFGAFSSNLNKRASSTSPTTVSKSLSSLDLAGSSRVISNTPKPILRSKDDSFPRNSNSTQLRRSRSEMTIQNRLFHTTQPSQSALTNALTKAGLVIPSIAVLTGDPVSTIVGAMTAFTMTAAFGPVIVPASRVLNSNDNVNLLNVLKDVKNFKSNPQTPTPDLDHFLEVTKLPKDAVLKELSKFSLDEDVLRLATNRALVYGIQQPLKKFFAETFDLDSMQATIVTAAFGTVLEQLLLFSADAQLGYGSLGPVKALSNRFEGNLLKTFPEESLAVFLEKNHYSLRGVYELSKKEGAVPFKDFLKSAEILTMIEDLVVQSGLPKESSHFKKEISGYLAKVDTLEDSIGDINLSLSKAREIFRGVSFSSARDLASQAISLTFLDASTPLPVRLVTQYLCGTLTLPPNNAMLECRKKGSFDVQDLKNFFKSGKAFEKLPFRLLLTTTPLAAIFIIRTELMGQVPTIKEQLGDPSEFARQSKIAVDELLADPTCSDQEKFGLSIIKLSLDGYLSTLPPATPSIGSTSNS